MSLLRKTVFGRAKFRQNTFIGGMATILSTPALLATKLGINEQRVKIFEVRGNDIRCCIVGSYVLPFDCFYYFSPTYFYDNSGNITNDLGGMRGINSDSFVGYFPGIINQTSTAVFQDGFKKKTIIMPNCTSLPDNYAGNGSGQLVTLVIPKCTSIGSSKLRNNVLIYPNYKVFVPISEQTSNAGAPDGDLAWLIANGGTVVWVPNTIAPEKITDLSIGLKTATTAQILFTNPESTNALQEFEVSIDAIPYQTITASGQYITGLTSGVEYKNITVKAIDIYYNRADESNQITFTTL